MWKLIVIPIVFISMIVNPSYSQEDTMKYRNLTEAEKREIIHKCEERHYYGHIAICKMIWG